MIKIIYGPKGFGKTKIIIDDVNASAKIAKGNVVLISDSFSSTVGVDFNVRCISTVDYGVNNPESFTGFIKGLIAGNSDIEYLYIDGITRITNNHVDELEPLFKNLEKLNIVIEVTVSATKAELPEYMIKYIA